MKTRRNKKNAGIYEGPVVFVDGFHYPVGEDGHKEGDQPLVVQFIDGGEAYTWGSDTSPKHQHVYERLQVEIEVEN